MHHLLHVVFLISKKRFLTYFILVCLNMYMIFSVLSISTSLSFVSEAGAKVILYSLMQNFLKLIFDLFI
jgi:hypothetical protein